jgi:hypothetical protein
MELGPTCIIYILTVQLQPPQPAPEAQTQLGLSATSRSKIQIQIVNLLTDMPIPTHQNVVLRSAMGQVE